MPLVVAVLAACSSGGSPGFALPPPPTVLPIANFARGDLSDLLLDVDWLGEDYTELTELDPEPPAEEDPDCSGYAALTSTYERVGRNYLPVRVDWPRFRLDLMRFPPGQGENAFDELTGFIEDCEELPIEAVSVREVVGIDDAAGFVLENEGAEEIVEARGGLYRVDDVVVTIGVFAPPEVAEEALEEFAELTMAALGYEPLSA